MLEIKLITASDTYEIRKRILRDNLDLSVDFNGDVEPETFHIGAYKEGELIGIVSFMKVANSNFKGSQFQLRGMAIVENHQGEGIGNKLLNKGLEMLIALDIEVLWCNARTPALKFYKRAGFQTFGEEFFIENAGPHYVMYKNM